MHILAAADPRLPSVELGRIVRVGPRSPAVSDNGSLAARSGGSPARKVDNNDGSKDPKRKGYQVDCLNQIKGDDYDVPRVIISLALEKHQTLSSDSCQKWLTVCPTLVKYATVEAAYQSFSTLVLLSIPVFIWNLLPDDPACSFVGYVTSPNIFKAISVSQVKVPAAVQVPMEDTLSHKETNINENKYESHPPSISCERCQKAKIKCDGSQPCCNKCKMAGRICHCNPRTGGKRPIPEEYVKALESGFVSRSPPLFIYVSPYYYAHILFALEPSS